MDAAAALDLPASTARSRSGLWTAVFLLVSAGLHGLALLYLASRPPFSAQLERPMELVMVEVEPPKPPPPPPPEPEQPKAKPPPIKVARAEVPKPPPPPSNEPPPPPPPNDAPPPEQPAKPVLVVGISMSSTTTAGNFAAAVGNTLYGKTEQKAADPNQVKAYSAPKYMPIHQVDSEPEVLEPVKVPYPPEAKHAEIEGTVVLSITIDPDGKVVAAKVLSGPGYGLNEAALEAMKKFKFKPARKNGEAVSTEIKYSYTFVLD